MADPPYTIGSDAHGSEWMGVEVQPSDRRKAIDCTTLTATKNKTRNIQLSLRPSERENYTFCLNYFDDKEMEEYGLMEGFEKWIQV